MSIELRCTIIFWFKIDNLENIVHGKPCITCLVCFRMAMASSPMALNSPKPRPLPEPLKMAATINLHNTKTNQVNVVHCVFTVLKILHADLNILISEHRITRV